MGPTGEGAQQVAEETWSGDTEKLGRFAMSLGRCPEVKCGQI